MVIRLQGAYTSFYIELPLCYCLEKYLLNTYYLLCRHMPQFRDIMIKAKLSLTWSNSENFSLIEFVDDVLMVLSEQRRGMGLLLT